MIRRAAKKVIVWCGIALALAWLCLGCGRNPPCPPPADRAHEREIVRDVLGDAAADDYEARCPG